MPQFNVGDRVTCVEPVDGKNSVVGVSGVIVSSSPFSGMNKPGVSFDKNVGGHDCGGLTKYGYGWYCPLYSLVLESPAESFPAPEILF